MDRSEREEDEPMAIVERQVQIARPVEEVFYFVANLRSWPRWIVHLNGIETEAAGAAVGVEIRVDLALMGHRIVVPYRVSECDPPRRLVGTELPAAEAEASHPRSLTFEFAPIGDGTRFTSRQEVRPDEAAFFGIDEELHRRAAARFINGFLETLPAGFPLDSRPPAHRPFRCWPGYS